MAWQTANLTRAEKLPSYKELVGEKPKEQTAEQMLAMVKLLHAAAGGD